jgi:hypothetical protein
MLSSEQNWHDVNVLGPNRRYTLLAPMDVSFDRSSVSAGVSVFCGRYRASRLKMTSVDVFRRERVRPKIFGAGACGLNGRLRTRKVTIAMKRRFRLRAFEEVRGRRDGRCAMVAWVDL